MMFKKQYTYVATCMSCLLTVPDSYSSTLFFPISFLWKIRLAYTYNARNGVDPLAASLPGPTKDHVLAHRYGRLCGRGDRLVLATRKWRLSFNNP